MADSLPTRIIAVAAVLHASLLGFLGDYPLPAAEDRGGFEFTRCNRLRSRISLSGAICRP